MHALDLIGGNRGGSQRNIHIPGFGGYESGILLLDQKYCLLDGRLFSVIVLVGFHDELLPFVPLGQLVWAGTDGFFCGQPEFVAVGFLRDNPNLGYGIDKSHARFVQLKFHGSVILCRTALQHGKIHVGCLLFCRVEGERHI